MVVSSKTKWRKLVLGIVNIVTCMTNSVCNSALPPTQQRFMSATTTKGAKENLEQYTSVSHSFILNLEITRILYG